MELVTQMDDFLCNVTRMWNSNLIIP